MSRRKLHEDSLGSVARYIRDAQPRALADAMEALERERKLLSPLTDAVCLAELGTATRLENEVPNRARLSYPLGEAKAILEGERSAVEGALSATTDINDAMHPLGLPTGDRLDEIRGAIGIENDLVETARKLNDPLGVNSSLDNALSVNNAVESLRATDTLRDAISAATGQRDVLEEHKRMSDLLDAAQPYRNAAYDAAADALSTVSAPSARNIPVPPARRGGARKKVTSAKVIGELVREARRKMKLNQQEFADLAGVGRRFVSELESGKPTLEFDKVMQACAAAGIDMTAASRSAS